MLRIYLKKKKKTNPLDAVHLFINFFKQKTLGTNIKHIKCVSLPVLILGSWDFILSIADPQLKMGDLLNGNAAKLMCIERQINRLLDISCGQIILTLTSCLLMGS